MTRWLRYRLPTIAISLVLLVLAVALLIVAVFAVNATRDAQRSADEADRATTCNGLLLKSIAGRAIEPEARAMGCDTTDADRLIERGLARDAEAKSIRERVLRVLAIAEAQAGITEPPTVIVTPAPDKTSAPSAPVPTVTPSPTQAPRPAPTRTQSPAPLPPSVPPVAPSPPPLLPGLICPPTLPALVPLC